MEEVKLS